MPTAIPASSSRAVGGSNCHLTSPSSSPAIPAAGSSFPMVAAASSIPTVSTPRIDRAFADSNSSTFIGSLTKAGAGTLTLANTHSYTGTTTVAGGTLLVQGSIATSTTTVESPAPPSAAPAPPAPSTFYQEEISPRVARPRHPRHRSAHPPDRQQQPVPIGHQPAIASTSPARSPSAAPWPSATPAPPAAAATRSSPTAARSAAPPPSFLRPATPPVLDTTTPGQVKVRSRANTLRHLVPGPVHPHRTRQPRHQRPQCHTRQGRPQQPPEIRSRPAAQNPVHHRHHLTKPSGTWLFTYTRPANRSDITYSVEISPDLQSNTWTSSGVTHQRLISGDPETWQASSASGSTALQFWRLKVSQP